MRHSYTHILFETITNCSVIWWRCRWEVDHFVVAANWIQMKTIWNPCSWNCFEKHEDDQHGKPKKFGIHQEIVFGLMLMLQNACLCLYLYIDPKYESVAMFVSHIHTWNVSASHLMYRRGFNTWCSFCMYLYKVKW